MSELIFEIYRELSRLEHDPEALWEEFDRLLEVGVDDLWGAPEDWHNLATIASRIDHYRAASALTNAGVSQWPTNLDLLAGVLQLYFGKYYDPQAAEEVWKRICDLPPELTRPYWRYWVYGASYFVKVHHDSASALELLEEGERYVKRDGLADIFRSYRRVYVDAPPLRDIGESMSVADYQDFASRMLIDKLTTGLELGVENGYTLAHELARAHQERYRSDQDGDTPQELEIALAYTDRAIQLYTGDSNHPLADILLTRARILLAMGRGRDTLDILMSLPATTRLDPSVSVMVRYAARMTGEELADGDGGEPEDLRLGDALQALLRDDAALLVQVARDNPVVLQAIVSAATQLQEGG